MVNFRPVAAEICRRVWDTRANFNSFGILAALLHGTLWASAELCAVEQRAPPIFGRAAITLGIGPHSSSLFFIFLFLAHSQPSHIGCLPYFHTWCGLSASLGCRSETCCTRLDRCKCRTQKIAKYSPSAHHGTTLSGYIFATKALIDNRKKFVKQQYISTCPNNIVN